MLSSRASLSFSLSLDRIKGLASAHGVSVDLFDGPEKERHEELDLSPHFSKSSFRDHDSSCSVCASTLARNGVSVTIFDSARGPGGRMSQRRFLFESSSECFPFLN